MPADKTVITAVMMVEYKAASAMLYALGCGFSEDTLVDFRTTGAQT